MDSEAINVSPVSLSPTLSVESIQLAKADAVTKEGSLLHQTPLFSTPTPPLTAHSTPAARRPVIRVSYMPAKEVEEDAADPVTAVAVATAASKQLPPPAREHHRQTQKSASTPPPVLRNPYGIEQLSRRKMALSGDGTTQKHSEHVDVEALLARRTAEEYDRCQARLRLVREERQTLLKKLEATKQQLKLLQARCNVGSHEIAAEGSSAVGGSEASKGQQKTSPPYHEMDRAVRQLRALDEANDELRKRYEELQQEKKRCLTVHNARLRRLPPEANVASPPAPAPATVVSNSSGGGGVSPRAASRQKDEVSMLHTRLACAAAEQRSLRQALALAMAKERGRLQAAAELNARGFPTGQQA